MYNIFPPYVKQPLPKNEVPVLPDNMLKEDLLREKLRQATNWANPARNRTRFL